MEARLGGRPLEGGRRGQGGMGGGHRRGPGEYLREGRPRRSRAPAQAPGERAAEAGEGELGGPEDRVSPQTV